MSRHPQNTHCITALLNTNTDHSSSRPSPTNRQTRPLCIPTSNPYPHPHPCSKVPAVDEVRVVFSHLGATSRTKAFMFWFHTSFLPPTTTSSAAKASSKKRSKGEDGGDTGGRFQFG